MRSELPSGRTCHTHGFFDPTRDWGCPDCVVQARQELRHLSERTVDELERHARRVAELEAEITAWIADRDSWLSRYDRLASENADLRASEKDWVILQDENVRLYKAIDELHAQVDALRNGRVL